MDGKQRCTHEGCRAWARRAGAGGSEAGEGARCEAHSRRIPRTGVGGRKGNQNARKHGLYASYVPVVALEHALDLPPGDLRLEIAVTRAALAELLNAELAPEAMVPALDRMTAALTRLLRTNKALETAGSNVIHEVLGQVLDNMRERGT